MIEHALYCLPSVALTPEVRKEYIGNGRTSSLADCRLYIADVAFLWKRPDDPVEPGFSPVWRLASRECCVAITQHFDVLRWLVLREFVQERTLQFLEEHGGMPWFKWL